MRRKTDIRFRPFHSKKYSDYKEFMTNKTGQFMSRFDYQFDYRSDSIVSECR